MKKIRQGIILSVFSLIGWGLLSSGQALATDPQLLFSTYLGGDNSEDPNIHSGGISYEFGDNAYSVAVDEEGTIYVAGSTDSVDFPLASELFGNTGQQDVFVSKISPDGHLEFSTYFGGSSTDIATDITVDAYGNIYVTGETNSWDFPQLNPIDTHENSDIFIVKISSMGELLLSTYFGGNTGSSERAYGIAVDADQNIYLTGYTYTDDFPTVNAIQGYQGGTQWPDAFVSKITISGSIAFSTYLGGIWNDIGYDIAVDSSQNIYVTGYSNGDGFPLVGAIGECDYGAWGFLSKISASGSLLLSTCIPGTHSSSSIAVDSSENIYVIGSAASGLSLVNEIQSCVSDYDAFVTKITSTGTIDYSTCLGGSDSDLGYSVAVDASHNIYISGLTLSSDFPLVDAIQDDLHYFKDAFVSKIDASGNLVFSTYLGGNDAEDIYYPDYISIGDWGWGIAVDSNGNVYVSGSTYSSDFPLVNEIQDNQPLGDAFVSKICLDLDADTDGNTTCGFGDFGPDCNDHDASINPRAEEICGDGIDQSCDGTDFDGDDWSCVGACIIELLDALRIDHDVELYRSLRGRLPIRLQYLYYRSQKQLIPLVLKDKQLRQLVGSLLQEGAYYLKHPDQPVSKKILFEADALFQLLEKNGMSEEAHEASIYLEPLRRKSVTVNQFLQSIQ